MTLERLAPSDARQLAALLPAGTRVHRHILIRSGYGDDPRVLRGTIAKTGDRQVCVEWDDTPALHDSGRDRRGWTTFSGGAGLGPLQLGEGRAREEGEDVA